MALKRAPEPQWVLEGVEPQRVGSLARELGVPELLAELLLRRGLSEGEEARLFLDSPLSSFSDPFLLDGMEAAVERLAEALSSGEPLGVFGDYDVDGVSAAALLTGFLRSLGAETHIYIPHRLREGYGLNLKGLKYLKEMGCRLVVAVDCGTASVEEVAEARGLGLSVIVADHHEPGDELPPALALLNPLKPGSPYPDKGLTGVGIALKLVAALRSRLRERGWPGELPNLREMLDLVALGTVADVAPLRGENRTLVRHGLLELTRGRRVGIAALKEVSGLGQGDVTAGQVGFILAPRLNAAGRVGEANPCLLP
ncbi:MAG: DHH family phosphoesterase [Nitrospinota bacterium]